MPSTRLRTFAAATMIVGAATFGLTACSSDSVDTEAAACEAYTGFADALAEAKTSLEGSPTVADIAAARDDVKAAYDTLDASLDEVSAERREALRDALNAYTEGVDDLEPDMSVPDATASLTEEIAAVQKAHDELEADLVCS